MSDKVTLAYIILGHLNKKFHFHSVIYCIQQSQCHDTKQLTKCDNVTGRYTSHPHLGITPELNMALLRLD